jgi:ABC-type sugar transport system substrate-binding protein
VSFFYEFRHFASPSESLDGLNWTVCPPERTISAKSFFAFFSLVTLLSRSALGADSSYDGGQPTHAKDLKGKKIVLADVPKLIGIGYFAATTKGEAEAATELTKNGLPTEVTTDAPTEAAIQKQIEYIDKDISRGMDGILFAAKVSRIRPRP